LALRESHDIRARNTDVLAAVTAAYQRHPTIRIADLAMRHRINHASA
jgi:hypothetical protein